MFSYLCLTWPHHHLTALLYLYMRACKRQLFTEEGSRRLLKWLNSISLFSLVQQIDNTMSTLTFSSSSSPLMDTSVFMEWLNQPDHIVRHTQLLKCSPQSCMRHQLVSLVQVHKHYGVLGLGSTDFSTSCWRVKVKSEHPSLSWNQHCDSGSSSSASSCSFLQYPGHHHSQLPTSLSSCHTYLSLPSWEWEGGLHLCSLHTVCTWSSKSMR